MIRREIHAKGRDIAGTEPKMLLFMINDNGRKLA